MGYVGNVAELIVFFIEVYRRYLYVLRTILLFPKLPSKKQCNALPTLMTTTVDVRIQYTVLCNVQIKILHNTLLTLISGIFVLRFRIGLLADWLNVVVPPPFRQNIFSRKVNAIVIPVFLFIFLNGFSYFYIYEYFDQQRLISIFTAMEMLKFTR